MEKEAYNMSKSEFRKSEIKLIISELSNKRLSLIEKGAYKIYLKKLLKDDDSAYQFHKDSIKLALDMGKFITKNVLLEYPELQEKGKAILSLIDLKYNPGQIEKMTQLSKEFIISNKVKANLVSVRVGGDLKVFELSLNDKLKKEEVKIDY